MMNLIQGGSVTLEDPNNVSVVTTWSGTTLDIDISAFLLTENEKVRSAEDFIFYNQLNFDHGIIQLRPGLSSCQIKCRLQELPQDIEKVVIAATVHDHQSFSCISSITVEITDTAKYSPSTDLLSEPTIILGQLYKRNEKWKFRALSQESTGGLGDLAKTLGVELSEGCDISSTIDLDHKIDKLGLSQSSLISLAQSARVSLQKARLENHVAAVAVCMDVSGSMSSMFRDGTVQSVVEQVLGLGINFDDNGCIDVFAFGSDASFIGELQPANFQSAARWILESENCGGGTRYAPAIHQILEFYQKRYLNYPAYVLFVTDGDNSDKVQTERALVKASHHAIFFQFVGIGEGTFPFLERLDTMPGRFIDNANFFQIKDPKAMTPDELYRYMMIEYPLWLEGIKQAKLIHCPAVKQD